MSTIYVTPRATEKAYRLSTSQNTYVFDAPLTANKQQIVAAIKEQYGVEVTSIKTTVQTGKSMRFSRGKKSYPGTTKRRDGKKAYVTLAEGNSIKVFDEVEQPDNKKKKEEK